MVRKQFVIFILFVLALLSKNVLFHAYVFGAEWPADIGQYICSQSGVVLLIASFVFLFRRPWWTLAVLAAVDIWVVTNWVYYQANGLFVSVSMLGMAGNLNGFTSSIGSFVDARLVWLLLPTLLYVVALCFYPRFEKRQVWPFAVTLLFGVGLVMCNNVLIHVDRSRQGYDDGALTWRQVLPLSINEKRMLIDWECEYSLVRDRSIIAYLPLHMVYEQTLKRFRDVSQETFTEDEKVLLGRLMHRQGEVPRPNSHLVLLLVESLESWVLEYEGVTPHINALRHGRPVLYADKVFSQARHGVSGDGQLTVNTGLLPIQSGAACILYGTNRYPGIAHLYPRSAVVNPSNGTWNKHVS